jgi:hypothetical protein
VFKPFFGLISSGDAKLGKVPSGPNESILGLNELTGSGGVNSLRNLTFYSC